MEVHIYKRTSPSDPSHPLPSTPNIYISWQVQPDPLPYFVWDNLSTESKACIDSVMIKIIDLKNMFGFLHEECKHISKFLKLFFQRLYFNLLNFIYLFLFIYLFHQQHNT